MTDREKAIVMAFTGKCMLTEDKFHIFHEYIEEIMGRPVFTHELADRDVQDKIKEKSKDDFIALCECEEQEKEPCEDCVSREQALLTLTGVNISTKSTDELIALFNKRIKSLPSVTPTCKKGKWIRHDDYYDCSLCGCLAPCTETADSFIWKLSNYCYDCGAEMEIDR